MPGRTPPTLIGTWKSGSKNPQTALAGSQPYSPSYQADQQQFYNDRAAEYGNTVPLSDAVDSAAQSPASQSRIQADYTPYSFIGSLTLVGQLLIPRNANRSDFLVANLSAGVIFVSYGPASNANVLGIPVAANATYSPTNGAVGINDIWIYANPTANCVVLGYEGVPAFGTPSSS